MVNTRKKFPREYGHGRANYINGPRVAGARSLPAKSDQVISDTSPTGASERAPGPGLKTAGYVWFFHEHKWKQRYDPSAKPKVTSHKPQAPIFRKRQAQRASGGKRQAPSNKL